MNLSTHVHKTRPVRFIATSAAAVGLMVALPVSAQAASVPVPLGTADSFVVLAGAGITNTGPTTLHGDLGTHPTTSITGTASLTVTGTNHGGDSVTQGAKTALIAAYNTAAGEGPTSPISGDLGNRKLKRGVYNSGSSLLLTGALTLDGAGNPDSVFVFQAGSALTTMSNSRVNLINGARSCNVFWQIGSSATLGTGSKFVGTVMAQQSVTATTGATVIGRLLARTGAVTLDTNTITRPTACTATGATGATDTTGATSGQVTKVPKGAVRTGDGSTSGGGHDLLGLTAGVLAFAGAGSAAIAASRRRRRVSV